MQVPNSLSEVTLSKFIRTNQLHSSDLDETEKDIMALSIMADVSEAEINDMDITDYHQAMAKINSFSLTDLPSVLPKEFDVQGKTYVIMADLKWKAGQYIAFKEFQKDAINNLHLLIATICHEKGKQYTTDDHKERADLFYEHLTMGVAYPTALFFSQVLKLSIDHILTSSNQNLRKNVKEDLKTGKRKKSYSPSIGGGGWLSTCWHRVTRLNTNK